MNRSSKSRQLYNSCKTKEDLDNYIDNIREHYSELIKHNIDRMNEEIDEAKEVHNRIKNNE